MSCNLGLSLMVPCASLRSNDRKSSDMLSEEGERDILTSPGLSDTILFVLLAEAYFAFDASNPFNIERN